MEYKCVDRGSSRCPCALMEAGQCYICTMSRTGHCSCGQHWQGVCPYNEFLQNGGRPAADLKEVEAPVLEVADYSRQLKVVRLQVPAGFAQKCQAAGSYIMVTSLGYKVPLSVLRSEVFCENGSGFIELAVQPAGPKTMELFRPGGDCWTVSGPFAAGLLNIEKLDFGKPVLVIGKGTAAAPFINIRSRLNGAVYIDSDKLTDAFLETYMGDREYEKISLQHNLEKLLPVIDRCPQIMFLASPYYTEKILQMRPERKSDIIIPNHANICCGVGICGACSYTDEDGVTVRRCKITERQL
ncbi:MAG: hypothetical protein IJB73_02830 [Firmicutes bacterium]|nr:hypothetical protein [Bacillota bacterium]